MQLFQISTVKKTEEKKREWVFLFVCDAPVTEPKCFNQNADIRPSVPSVLHRFRLWQIYKITAETKWKKCRRVPSSAPQGYRASWEVVALTHRLVISLKTLHLLVVCGENKTNKKTKQNKKTVRYPNDGKHCVKARFCLCREQYPFSATSLIQS